MTSVYLCYRPYRDRPDRVFSSLPSAYNYFEIIAETLFTGNYEFKTEIEGKTMFCYVVHQPREWDKNKNRYLCMTIEEVEVND